MVSHCSFGNLTLFPNTKFTKYVPKNLIGIVFSGDLSHIFQCMVQSNGLRFFKSQGVMAVFCRAILVLSMSVCSTIYCVGRLYKPNRYPFAMELDVFFNSTIKGILK